MCSSCACSRPVFVLQYPSQFGGDTGTRGLRHEKSKASDLMVQNNMLADGKCYISAHNVPYLHDIKPQGLESGHY
jgi:hypothetical protein